MNTQILNTKAPAEIYFTYRSNTDRCKYSWNTYIKKLNEYIEEKKHK